MDVSITTMTTTHLFIAGTLFSILLIWIFLFALLALRPEAKTRVEEPTPNTLIVQSTPTTPASVVSTVDTHIFEEQSNVEVAQAV
jgi:hypothetical protein